VGKKILGSVVHGPTYLSRLLSLRLLGGEPTVYRWIHLPPSLLARNSVFIVSHNVSVSWRSKLVRRHRGKDAVLHCKLCQGLFPGGRWGTAARHSSIWRGVPCTSAHGVRLRYLVYTCISFRTCSSGVLLSHSRGEMQIMRALAYTPPDTADCPQS